MKYKIYCNNKEYKIGNYTTYGYGDVIKAPWGEYVAIKLWDGDIMYLQKDNAESGYDYVLYSSLESGLDYSIFYVSPINQEIDQSGDSGWLCFPNTLQEHGDFLRIYKFYEDTYDLEIGGEIDDEQACRKEGTLVAILQFTTDADGEEVWRFLDPTIAQYNGQWIELPTMRDKLFISSFAKTKDDYGYYYLFESGTEGIGFIRHHTTGNIINNSSTGWFGAGSPTENTDLYIYDCGSDWYDLQDALGEEFNDYWDWSAVNHYFSRHNIQPTILRYNEDTELWYLVQEGTRYDY